MPRKIDIKVKANVIIRCIRIIYLKEMEIKHKELFFLKYLKISLLIWSTMIKMRILYI